MGCRGWGLGFGALGKGFRISGVRFRVRGLRDLDCRAPLPIPRQRVQFEVSYQVLMDRGCAAVTRVPTETQDESERACVRER